MLRTRWFWGNSSWIAGFKGHVRPTEVRRSRQARDLSGRIRAATCHCYRLAREEPSRAKEASNDEMTERHDQIDRRTRIEILRPMERLQGIPEQLVGQSGNCRHLLIAWRGRAGLHRAANRDHRMATAPLIGKTGPTRWSIRLTSAGCIGNLAAAATALCRTRRFGRAIPSRLARSRRAIQRTSRPAETSDAGTTGRRRAADNHQRHHRPNDAGGTPPAESSDCSLDVHFCKSRSKTRRRIGKSPPRCPASYSSGSQRLSIRRQMPERSDGRGASDKAGWDKWRVKCCLSATRKGSAAPHCSMPKGSASTRAS
jgi:hypothetical protein